MASSQDKEQTTESSPTTNPQAQPNTHQLSFSDMSQADMEQAFTDTFRKARYLSRSNVVTDEVLMAKLAMYTLRQLHATSDIYQRTAIRAATFMELNKIAGERRSTGGAVRAAKSSIREEERAALVGTGGFGNAVMQATGNSVAAPDSDYGGLQWEFQGPNTG
jgi:hypothetical protein